MVSVVIMPLLFSKNTSAKFFRLIRLFRHSKPDDRQLAQFIYQKFGIRPGKIDLYHQACLHKSSLRDEVAAHEKSNERLEFLGDAVLDAIVAEYLFEKYPTETEGYLTKLKSKIVKRETLNFLGEKLSLEKQVKHTQYGINNPKSLLGNAFEALIGAIYLDKGYVVTKKCVIRKILLPHINVAELAQVETDYKSRIIIWSQREKRRLEFFMLREENLGAEMLYEVELRVDQKAYSSATGKTKKEAEQQVARQVWEIFHPEKES